jgi:hypothetical protein
MTTPKKKKVHNYVKYKCRLCSRAITSLQKHFHMGICNICTHDIPDHVPWVQTHKYLVNKILKRGADEKPKGPRREAGDTHR